VIVNDRSNFANWWGRPCHGLSPEQQVRRYWRWLAGDGPEISWQEGPRIRTISPRWVWENLPTLAGFDLAEDRTVDVPSHADLLLELLVDHGLQRPWVGEEVSGRRRHAKQESALEQLSKAAVAARRAAS
jgi:hypothetical protein